MATRRQPPSTLATVLFCLIAVAASSNAQPPVAGPISEPWRTLETVHFRIHFQPPAESFARAVTARVEAVRAEVASLVGHFPDKRVDVVIGGRVAVASGRGLPFLEGPRVLLHATPPAAARLEDFDDWIGISLGHELAHIAHLSRPPENKVLSFLARTLPVASLILHLPQWVPDAYAAAIEDRLACAGRPRRPLQGALLRQMAANGRLPDLDDLDGDTAWPHITRREAVGADFLRWLEERPHGTLPGVWRRMTASAPRTFRGSVARTYGAKLEQLYAAWRRELETRWADGAATAPEGIAIEALSAPHVAADGAVVMTLRRHDGRPRLAVLERDGEVRRWLDLDVEPSAQPRWLPDGSVLFVRGVADREDESRGDLFRWWPESERLERLTVGADLRAVDGAADGSWAAAVENRWGATALVRVSLDREPADIGASAAIETLVAATADTLLDAPRLAPDGRRLAFLRHQGAGWRLVVRDLASGAERELGDPGLRVLAWPAWSPDGDWIVVTVAVGDAVRLEAWSAAPELVAGANAGDRGRRILLSDPSAIAMAGAFDAGDPGDPSREPALLHLELFAEPQGVWLLRQPWRAAMPGPGTAGDSEPAAQAAPAAAPAGTATAPCREPAPASGESRPYGRGPTTYSSLLGGGFSPSANHVISGWRGGDVIGRWEAVAIISASASGAESGGLLSAAWRGWHLPIQFHGYSVERRPSQQPESVPGLGESLDLVERGFALESGWRDEKEHRTLKLDVAVMAHKLLQPDAATVERYALQFGGDADWAIELPAAARLRLGTSLFGASGWTDSAAWRRYGGELRGGVSRAVARRIYALDARWSALVAEDARLVHDRLILGGTASSLIPERLDLGRIYEAALPAGTAIGDRWESQRLTASREGTRVRVFWARHRLGEAGAGRGDWLRLAGVEIAADRDTRPLFRLPSSTVRVGAAYVFDQPFRHVWMYWAGLAWTL